MPRISKTLAGSPAVGEIPPNPLSFQLAWKSRVSRATALPNNENGSSVTDTRLS